MRVRSEKKRKIKALNKAVCKKSKTLKKGIDILRTVAIIKVHQKKAKALTVESG